MRKLAGYRVTAGYKQKEVADILGVTQISVSLWERGKCKPTIDKVPQIAKLYGVSEKEILEACVGCTPDTSIIQQKEGVENV